MAENIPKLKNSKDTIEDKINIYFDDLIQLLNDRRSILLSQLRKKRTIYSKTKKKVLK